MAITTLDGVIAGNQPPIYCMKNGATMEAAGVTYTHFYAGGVPGAASAPSPGLAGEALTSFTGQLDWNNPSGGSNSYLSRLTASASATGQLALIDRLWHNSGLAVTTTTAQTVNSVAFPARDRNGNTDGVGVMVAIEVRTATTNASAVTNTTMSYTNSAGVSGRTATIPSVPATAAVGTFVQFALQSGDQGVRSIQSVTLGTSYGGGAIHLVAYRQFVSLSITTANIGAEINPVTGGFPRLYDNTVPQTLWNPTATAAVNINFLMTVAQG